MVGIAEGGGGISLKFNWLFIIFVHRSLIPFVTLS